MAQSDDITRIAGGDIVLWIDGGIHLKVQEPYGDPVELAEHEAEELAKALLQLAAKLRA